LFGTGIDVRGESTVITNNMVSNQLWTGSFQGRREPENFMRQASFSTWKSTGLFHHSLPLMNSFNKTEAATFPKQALLP